MFWSKKTLSILLLLAGNRDAAKAAFWSGNEERQVQEQDASTSEGGQVHYGVDVSFPIHYHHVSTNYDWLPHNLNPSIRTPKEFEEMVPQPLGNKQEFYNHFMKTCRDAYGKKGIRCQQTEDDRVAMNLRQPQSMQNYTDVGFKSKSCGSTVNMILCQNNLGFSRWLPYGFYCCRNSCSRSFVGVDKEVLGRQQGKADSRKLG